MSRSCQSSPGVPQGRCCKIFDPERGRYFAARVVSHASTGLLVQVPHECSAEPESWLLVGCCTNPAHAVIRQSDMVMMRITRRMAAQDGGVLLALERRRQPGDPGHGQTDSHYRRLAA